MPRYEKKTVKLPEGMEVGSDVGVVGEGDDSFKIEKISRDPDGNVVRVHLDCGWREPLCKIYLLRGDNHYASFHNPANRIDVAIGECDVCGMKFPDSCAYHTDAKNPDSMVCGECHKKRGGGGGVTLLV